jgi:predicted  nucleic acid-binding Zn-ribbon protein
MKNINELNANIQALLNEENARSKRINAANIEIERAKAALKEARKQKRLAKNGKDIDYKQYAENMAELVRQLPVNQLFTPTQLAHLYSVAFPEFRNVGVLHIYLIYQGCCGYKVRGLNQDRNGRYYRSDGEVTACRW